MDRRSFLGRTGVAVAGIASGVARPWETAAGSRNDTTAQDDAAAQTAFDPTDWSSVRAQFWLTDDVVDLATLYLASHPAPVREAIEAHRRALDASPVRAMERRRLGNEREAIATAAAYMGASTDDIAITDSTTMGLGLLYGGLLLRPGDEILTTTHDFYATHEAARLAAERAGATVRKVALYDDPAAATPGSMAARLADAIGPATRVVAITWVHSSTGVKLPVRAIADAVAQVNRSRDHAGRVLLCVDGVHGFGVEDAGPPELGCDFFAAGCHKWLFGPRGTGILWGARWDAVQPTIPSFREGMGDWFRDTLPGPTTAARMTPGGFKPFEHVWALGPAFEFHRAIGRDRVAARTHELARRLKEGLANTPRVRLITPLDDEASAGIVCFDVAGQSASETVGMLQERGIIATVTPYAETHARLSPSIRNMPEEIDAVIAAVRAIT